eukprot:5851353-Pyramimonas_sp.AAC.1
MWTPPLGPSVELPMGPRSAALGGNGACELFDWGLLWGSRRGLETLYWVGETHVSCSTGAFGRAPYEATERRVGWGKRM